MSTEYTLLAIYLVNVILLAALLVRDDVDRYDLLNVQDVVEIFFKSIFPVINLIILVAYVYNQNKHRVVWHRKEEEYE